MAERSEPDLNMRQLPMPTPYVVGEIKVYTFEVNGQLILFDTGPPTDEARQFLRENIELDRLSYVFITHWHPEHCGLAAFLEEETSAEIIISKYDLISTNLQPASTRPRFVSPLPRWHKASAEEYFGGHSGD